ncbi:MAG: aconitase/3-isopropylmalate dehydratase large subunit family protein [Rhodospirillaceae bacterium]|jgi:3-isopropylmalate/(R)-2-methylmalate dehydratase large subunit
MGATASEKILARVSGQKSVKPGDIVYPEPDYIIMHDLHAHIFLRELWDMGLKELWKPERVVVAIDHRVPAHNVKTAGIHQEIRDWVEKYKIGHFYDINDTGITHMLQVERGIARPGNFIVAKDVHCTNAGAVGSLAFPLVYDIPAFLALGSAWVRVPETVRINLNGKARPGVFARDVVQASLAQLGYEDADYRVIEFGGDYVDQLSIDGRQILCNVVIESGAKSGFTNPDQKAIDYTKSVTGEPFEPAVSDPDCEYALTLEFDVAALEPQLAAPPSPDNIVSVASVAGKSVNQAFVGACSGGTLQDLRHAAAELKDHRVSPNVRLLIAPSTQRVLNLAAQEGLVDIFTQAGATVLPPGCSACAGSVAPIADGERCISTSTRNEPGRMGSNVDTEVYLANAATVAASAVAGEIAVPTAEVPE